MACDGCDDPFCGDCAAREALKGDPTVVYHPDLQQFSARVADDPVKRDLELTCDTCGIVVCDIEAGDNLSVLASIATDHKCQGSRIERLKREKKKGK